MSAIALVDDDRHTLVSLGMALRSAGYRIRNYGDGPSALEALLNFPPDIVIPDINMPGMNGMELLRRLRETSETPVIFLTARTPGRRRAAPLSGAASWSWIRSATNARGTALRSASR